MRKNANEKWRLSESKLRRHYIVAVVQQQRGQHQWWRRSTSATRPDPPTRCYIKTCQLQRRFISHSIDSSLPYFNRPIHQERSDSLLCQNCAADIQRGLTKFLWFFDIYWIKKGINSSGDMTEKEVSIFSSFDESFFLLHLRSMKTYLIAFMW